MDICCRFSYADCHHVPILLLAIASRWSCLPQAGAKSARLEDSNSETAMDESYEGRHGIEKLRSIKPFAAMYCFRGCSIGLLFGVKHSRF